MIEIDKIIQHIRNLPPLPQSVIEIEKVIHDPNGSISDIIKIVKKDPLLTANILKAANSPLYGFSKQIKSIEQAVSLFGMNTVRGFAVAAAIKNNLKIDLSPYGINEEIFFENANLKNAFITKWYKKYPKDLEVLSISAFLLEIGMVVISSVIKSENLTQDFLNSIKEIGQIKTEQKFLNLTSTQISAEIFQKWKFEDEIVESIRYTLSPNKNPLNKKYSQILKIVYLLTNITKKPTNDDISASINYAKKNNLLADELQKTIEELNI